MPNKPIYGHYHFQAEALLRQLRTVLGITKKQIGHKQSFYTLLKHLMEKPGFKDSMEMIVLAEEYSWLHCSKKPVIFPESTGLFTKMRKAKIESKGLQFTPLWPQYLVSFPRDIVFHDQSIEGCLITHMRFGERRKMINKMLTDAQLSPLEIFGDSLEDELILTVTYLTSLTHNGALHKGYSRAVLPQMKINDILSAKNHADFREHLGHIGGNKNQALELTENDSAVQYELISHLARFLVYIQMLGKDVLTPGLPIGKKTQLHGSIISGALTNLVVSQEHSIERATSLGAAKERAWHLRTLVHEKYYRIPEWQNEPRGSRIILVSGSGVDGDISPYTAGQQTL